MRGESFLEALACRERDYWRQNTSAFVVVFGIKRGWSHFAPGFFQQDFDARFRLFELRLAISRKLHSFLEKLHCLIERQVGALELANDLFEACQALFEVRLP